MAPMYAAGWGWGSPGSLAHDLDYLKRRIAHDRRYLFLDLGYHAVNSFNWHASYQTERLDKLVRANSLRHFIVMAEAFKVKQRAALT